MTRAWWGGGSRRSGLAPPRIATPYSADPRDRITHAYGASYRDTVRAFRGRVDHRPTASRSRVARPTSRRCSSGRPEPFAAALRGAKAAIDPRGLLNPGVLVDPLYPAGHGQR